MHVCIYIYIYIGQRAGTMCQLSSIRRTVRAPSSPPEARHTSSLQSKQLHTKMKHRPRGRISRGPHGAHPQSAADLVAWSLRLPRERKPDEGRARVRHAMRTLKGATGLDSVYHTGVCEINAHLDGARVFHVPTTLPSFQSWRKDAQQQLTQVSVYFTDRLYSPCACQ